MQYQNHLQQIPVEDFFTKTLKGKVAKWNETFAGLQGRLAEIPQRRAALSVAVAEASISGAAALQERRDCYEAEVALQIDLARHVKAKDDMAEPIKAAYRAESAKLKTAAEKRQDDILGQLGNLLNPEQKAQAVRGDSTYSALSQRASGYRQAAVSFGKGAQSAAGWLAEYSRNMAATFGAPAAPAGSGRVVEIIGGANHGTSIFK